MFNIVTIRFMQNASTQKYGEWKIGEKYFHIIIARFRLHLTREIECFVSNWIFCVGYVWATSIVWEQLLDQITYDKHMTHYFQQKIRKIPSFFRFNTIVVDSTVIELGFVSLFSSHQHHNHLTSISLVFLLQILFSSLYSNNYDYVSNFKFSFVLSSF